MEVQSSPSLRRLNSDGHSLEEDMLKLQQHGIATRPRPRSMANRRFSVLRSTEDNNATDDMKFYGPYAHIRKTLDYTYHRNYRKERQWLQDAIIEEMLETVKITDVNGDVCTTPTEPWIVFTAGAMGAGKSYTINTLVEKGRFPLLAFVSVDPDEIRRHLPEFSLYVEQCPGMAGELTRKEAGYVAEVLTLAGLQAGKNVLVDGSLRDCKWYEQYFKRLRMEHQNLKIAILHITAPREAVFHRAASRAIKTGRVVPRETIEMALEQVPRSVKRLAPKADYFCELHNAPGAEDIELATDGEDWDTFQANWLQACAWVPGKKKKKFSARKYPALGRTNSNQLTVAQPQEPNVPSFTPAEKQEASNAAIKACPLRKGPCHSTFSAHQSTEENNRSDDMSFFGPFSHIRKMLDYTFHCNYTKERQWLQDAIIMECLNNGLSKDENGRMCKTPTEPWLVLTAGVMGAGKRYTIDRLAKDGRFPLISFVTVDCDEIRRNLPEFAIYLDQCPDMVGELTRKEAGYTAEILALAAIQAGRNVVVDSPLEDILWYKAYIGFIRSNYIHHKIALLHITAPRGALFERAAKRALETGHQIPKEHLEANLKQVPGSVNILKPLVDYFAELHNASGTEIELLTDGEDWQTFERNWSQICAYYPVEK